MRLSEPFVGEPVEVVREKSEDDLLLERKLKREEQVRLEAEKEARSVIPLNEDYETRIFASCIVDWDCRMISHLMIMKTSASRLWQTGVNTRRQQFVSCS